MWTYLRPIILLTIVSQFFLFFFLFFMSGADQNFIGKVFNSHCKLTRDRGSVTYGKLLEQKLYSEIIFPKREAYDYRILKDREKKKKIE